MLDELNNNLQEAGLIHDAPAQEAPVEQKKSESPDEQSSKEKNIRLLRERMENAERRALELERQMQLNMQQKESQRIQLVEDDDFDFSDDSYIEGKQLKKYVKTLKQELKNTKKQFEEFHQQTALNNAEMRLKTQFPDFESVVSKENLESLAAQDPQMYQAIMDSPDIYRRGYVAYKNIKNSGIITSAYAHEDRKLEENRSKPRAAATAAPQSSDTPLSRMGDYDRRILTEERRKQLLKQVAEAKMLR